MIKKKIIFTVIIAFSISIVAQSNIANQQFKEMLSKALNHTVDEVSPNELVALDNVIYLDSRAKKEFNISHIKGARWVGFNFFNMSRVSDISKNKKIVVYCTVGCRSERIAEKLVKEGYTDVSNLYGGIFEWVHHNNAVYNESGVTEEIHTFDENWGQWLDKGIKIL